MNSAKFQMYYTGKMSTCVKHMFKTTHVKHMFNMCETCVKIHICLTRVDIFPVYKN